MSSRGESSGQGFTLIKKTRFTVEFVDIFIFTAVHFALTVNILFTPLPKCCEANQKVLLAAVGQQVQLSCRTNHSTPVEWWYRESDNSSTKSHIYANGNFTASYRDRVRPMDTSDGNYDFVLQNVQRSDEGIYVCAEDVGFGEQHSYRLEVSDYVSAKVGSALSLPCYSTTRDVEWLFQSSSQADTLNVYSNGFIYDKFKDRFRLSKSSDVEFNLEVREVTEHDSGYYTCNEDGNFSTDRHTVRVIVSRVASIGETVTLSCWTKYNVSVSWWYMGKTMGDRIIIYIHSIISKAYLDRFTVHTASDGYNNLIIENIQQSDYGFYVCLEKNGEKDRHFIELRKPEPRPTTAVFDLSTRKPDGVASTTCNYECLRSEVTSSTAGLLSGLISSLILSTIVSVCLCIVCRRNRELLRNAQQQQQRPEVESLTKRKFLNCLALEERKRQQNTVSRSPSFDLTSSQQKKEALSWMSLRSLSCEL